MISIYSQSISQRYIMSMLKTLCKKYGRFMYLKPLLLHNDNKKQYIPIFHGMHMKGACKNLNNGVEKVRDTQHAWKIYADLNISRILLEMKGIVNTYTSDVNGTVEVGKNFDQILGCQFGNVTYFCVLKNNYTSD